MIPPRRGLLALTTAPVLLVSAVLATVIAVGTMSPAPTTRVSDLALLPLVEFDPEGCSRDRDGAGTIDTPIITAQRRVSSELIVSCPARFDGLRVTYFGEAVGDLLVRDGGAWVLVNDDDYALEIGPLPGHREHRGTNGGLSVWLPDPLPTELTGLGRPGIWGDVIEVTGVIRRTDPADGGGLTLRAQQLTVLQPARPVDQPLDQPLLALALGATVAAIAMVVLRRRGSRLAAPERRAGS